MKAQHTHTHVSSSSAGWAGRSAATKPEQPLAAALQMPQINPEAVVALLLMVQQLRARLQGDEM